MAPTTAQSAASRPLSWENQPTSTPRLIFEGVYGMGLSAGSGALVGLVTGVISPVGGLVYGAASALTAVIARTVSEKFFHDNLWVKTAITFASFAASIAAGVFAVSAMGISLSVGSVVILSLGMIVAGSIFLLAHGAMGCYTRCIGASILLCSE